MHVLKRCVKVIICIIYPDEPRTLMVSYKQYDVVQWYGHISGGVHICICSVF